MKQVIYSDNLKQDPKGYSAVQAATNILKNVSTRSRDEVTAEWDKATDAHGRPAYILRLSDWAGSASKVFALHELELTDALWSRLWSVWDDLLASRSNRLREESRQLAGQEN